MFIGVDRSDNIQKPLTNLAVVYNVFHRKDLGLTGSWRVPRADGFIGF